MRTYNIKFNVGKSKYVINFHDGIKKHKDGSKFFDIAIFKNRTAFDNFQRELISKGFRYE